ncbi:hypothetical protein SEA_UPYO_59 [Gordonia phage Upyo]|nr:hypothetical protein SEA_UPYO_59 [Gordonia phage Upyo]
MTDKHAPSLSALRKALRQALGQAIKDRDEAVAWSESASSALRKHQNRARALRKALDILEEQERDEAPAETKAEPDAKEAES